jgi:hypothetical protein
VTAEDVRELAGLREFAARVTARWRAIDSLLPVPVPAERGPGCGAELVVGSGGRLAAFGTCQHGEPAPGEIGLSRGTARRFELAPRVTAPEAGMALDRLISLWRDHLADAPGAGDDDTAAVITWPSRDVDGVTALQRHGLRPLAVVAVRLAPRGRGGTPGKAPRGVRIRRAGPADAETVAQLGAAAERFDAHFSGTPGWPGTVAARHREAGRLLAPAPEAAGTGAAAWTWLAERHHGGPVGVIAAHRPDHAAWIAPMTRLSPVACTTLGYVRPQERGAGVGAALAARLHGEIDPVGIAATLLRYEQLNPYAAAFWSRQRYRPLWTMWEARPALSLR